MDLTREYLDGVVELAQDAQRTADLIHLVDGVPMSTRALVDVRPKLAEPAPIKVTGLTDVAAYVNSNPDRIPEGELVVRVPNPRVVEVVSVLKPPHNQRFTYLTATAPERLAVANGFRFGVYFEQEAFVIGLNSSFEPNDNLEDLISLAGNIVVEHGVEKKDDGISQGVVVRQGVRRNAETVLPRRISLAPYRTFPEVPQPASDFLVRINKDNGHLALFEADGQAWTVEAVARVKSWLVSHLPANTPVI
jgi:hypothetical protein